jgi:hypothetical protein
MVVSRVLNCIYWPCSSSLLNYLTTINEKKKYGIIPYSSNCSFFDQITCWISSRLKISRMIIISATVSLSHWTAHLYSPLTIQQTGACEQHCPSVQQTGEFEEQQWFVRQHEVDTTQQLVSIVFQLIWAKDQQGSSANEK